MLKYFPDDIIKEIQSKCVRPINKVCIHLYNIVKNTLTLVSAFTQWL